MAPDINKDGVPDHLETLDYLLKAFTPILILISGVALAVFGVLKDKSQLADLGLSLTLGGSLATNTTKLKEK